MSAGSSRPCRTFISSVGWFIVNGDRAAINWVFAYTTPDGRKVQLDEVASQEWHDGKIVRERFYYDPAQRLRGLD